MDGYTLLLIFMLVSGFLVSIIIMVCHTKKEIEAKKEANIKKLMNQRKTDAMNIEMYLFHLSHLDASIDDESTRKELEKFYKSEIALATEELKELNAKLNDKLEEEKYEGEKNIK